MVERWFPTVLALLAGIATFKWAPPTILGSENALMFIGGLGAIAIGFTATGLTILIAIEDRPVMRWVRHIGKEKYLTLLRYMISVLHWWFLGLLLAGLAFVINLRTLPNPVPYVIAALLVALCVGGMGAWYRVSRITIQLLRANVPLAEQKLHPEDPAAAQLESTTRKVAG